MKTKEFLTLLTENPSKELLFEFQPGEYLGANYHITEIKNTHIDSVDCGGRTDQWNETIVQLWESPSELDKTDYLTTTKAIAILNRVHGLKPMDLEAEVKFEYGNSKFHTAHLYVQEYQDLNARLLIKLGVENTTCKARDLCGEEITKQVEVVNECAPNSGCC
ncbi:MAG: hypothetical protein KJN75_03090 [Muriicola sp.]|nr:hypothetical protein [Muriicola sp.]